MVQNAGNKLTQVVLRQVEKAEYFCSAENISPNVAIHELRKTFKRLRALFRIYEHVSGSKVKNLRTEIKEFGKVLSPLRESYVNTDLFEKELTGKKFIPERKMKLIGEKLHNKNKKLIDERFREKSVCKRIGSYFSRFETKLNVTGGEKVSKAHVVREVYDSYLTSFSTYRGLPDNPAPEEWHSMRKKLKRLYFQLDFIRLFHPRYFKLKSEQLNTINDQLGDDHDLHVFAEELHQEDYQLNAEELKLMEKQIEHLRELNQLKLRPRLKHFFGDPPGEFKEKLEKAFKIEF